MSENESENAVSEEPYRKPRLTMEVPFFLTMFGIGLTGAVISNVLLYRTCVHTLNHSVSECALLLTPGPKSNETRQLEHEVQQYASIVKMVHSVIEAFFPAILSFFLGIWSDMYGRKPLVVWSLLGACMSSFLVVIFVAINSLSPWWFLVTAIPFSLTGAHTTLYTGAYCYISDVTTKNDRSFRSLLGRTDLVVHKIDTGDSDPIKQRCYRLSPEKQKALIKELDSMIKLDVVEKAESPWLSPVLITPKANGEIALLEAALFAGAILGSLSSPYALKLLGYVYLFILTSAVYVVAYVYTNVWIVESHSGTATGSLWSVLDCSLLKEMIQTCFKQRPNKERSIIFILLICNALTVLVSYGLSNVEYLYTREKLLWSLDAFSVYRPVGTLVMIIGMLLGVVLMQKVLKINDIYLILLSYLSSIADYLTRAFAVTSWHMYLGMSLSLFRGIAPPLTISLLTKMVPTEELAKVFGLQNILNAFLPLLAPLIFGSLYSVTLNVFPGCIYILCAFVYFTDFVMICIVKYLISRYSSPAYTLLQDEIGHNVSREL